MTKTYLKGVLALCIVQVFSLSAQTVKIDYSVQRFLGNTSQLDRTKYFTIHSGSSDTEMNAFYTNYNVSKGRSFWGPFSYAKQKTGSVGTYPAYKNGGTGVRAVSHFIATEHPGSVFKDGMDKNAAANWAVEYWKNFANDAGRPMFFEPMNEPFVHASDFYSGGWNSSEEARIKLQMAQVFSAIGQKMHAAPELANMKVLGYSSAWPSLELNDFGHWNDNQKMFMDVAGQNMDGFAIHLYDGVNVTGQNNLRSGSNSEAILDLVEAYSYIKWGTIKPHAITEYGGIASGYGSTYSDTESAQTVRSFNHIIFNLLERENDLLISIPFATDKSTWHLTAANNYQPYGAVLLRPANLGEPTPTGWVYTPKIYFYDLWKEFKGKRVYIDSDNPDIQVQAFAQGTKLYIALNNLHTASKTVNLNFINGLAGFQNVRTKSLKIYDNQAPVFSNTTSTTAPTSLTLIAGETVTLEYTFSSNISFNNAIRSQKYYPNKYLQPISSGTPISFSFGGVATGTGKATLRMTIGRKHNVSKSPVVKVNGTTVAVPGNWKGYDQANRDDFFGTIEIPVDMSLLNTSNTVELTFPDNGGHVASLILAVEKFDTDVALQQAYPSGTPQGIPGTIEAENYDLGGEGLAYHDTSTGNNGNKYRNDGVDVETCAEGGYNIGWTENGEWLEYTVDVAQAGDYKLDLRYASKNTAGSAFVEFDGVNKTNSISLPATGGWQSYATVSKTISLPAGQQVMRVNVESKGFNLNNYNLTLLAPAIDSLFCKGPQSLTPSTSYTVDVDYEASQSRDIVVEFWNTGWIAQATVNVPKGIGTAQVSVTLPSAPAVGTGYIWKSSIRPTGGDWTTSLDNHNVFNVEVLAAQSPYGGSNHAIPGTIEGEEYDLGGEGIAFHDNDVSNNGGNVFRSSEAVDIGNGDGGAVVGWTNSGEWLEYTSNTASGTYDLALRVSSPNSGKRISVLVDGTNIATVTVPNTGAWTAYQTVTVHNIALTAKNNRVLRLEFPDGGLNLNWVKFAVPLPTVETVDCSLLPSSISSQTSYTVSVPYAASQNRDVIVEIWSSTGWLGYGKTTVNAGTSTATVNVNVSSAPAPGSGYLWKSSIRPVGTDWTQNIDACNANNVTITANAPLSTAVNGTSKALIRTYPNPFNESLTIELGANHAYGTLSIYDVYGRLVTQQNITGQSFVQLNKEQLNELQNGMCYLRLSGLQHSKTIPLVKE